MVTMEAFIAICALVLGWTTPSNCLDRLAAFQNPLACVSLYTAARLFLKSRLVLRRFRCF